MKNDRWMLVLVLMVVPAMICGCDATRFSYDMASVADDGGPLSFYTPPAETATLKAVSGDRPRHVIVCIGDGMGFHHVTLSRQAAGADRLWMETLPVTGQLMTGSANKAITDSAAAGTAMACGIKTNNGMIGMAPDKTPYRSILEVLADAGWKTGLVATSTITHATPASFAAHVPSRNDQAGIAPQMLANRVDVMLGGGRKYWLGSAAGGEGNLLQAACAQGYRVVETRDALAAVTAAPVLGLFGEDGLTTASPEPSIAEMSAAAMDLLSRDNPTGFFLMIEGSQIDWAAHANDTDRVIRQTLLFDMAVREAIAFAKRNPRTLVIVTSDHETGGLELEPDGDDRVRPRWTSGGHTTADVPIYAFGPGAEAFAGTLDNTDLPKRIAALTGIEAFPVVTSSVEQTALAK